MNINGIKANERRLFSYVNNRDFEAADNWIDQHVSDDFTNHSPVFDAEPNKEGLKQMLKALTSAFPEIIFDIREIAVDGNLIFFRLFMHGMNEKPLMGMVMLRTNTKGKISDRWALAG